MDELLISHRQLSIFWQRIRHWRVDQTVLHLLLDLLSLILIRAGEYRFLLNRQLCRLTDTIVSEVRRIIPGLHGLRNVEPILAIQNEVVVVIHGIGALTQS